MTDKGWEPVIGLEIHAQLATQSKIFSGAPTAYGAPPNTQACAVDLGLPGVLPVLNREAVRMAVRFGLAIEARVSRRSVFARKNYFYPDLPKGYQISQYELPIVAAGHTEITLEDGGTKRVGITRAHLEEDAGKSLHEDFHGMSGIDLNRAGTPLLEIVSEPDLRSAKEAVTYMRKIHTLVRYLGICDGNMQEGSFRCDANVSVRKTGEARLGTRAEVKNLNSFRFVERAICHEIERQIALLEAGGTVVLETRLYDPDRDETRPMREKEEANDYRYFPDPDLLPLVLSEDFIEAQRADLPELPDAKRQRFIAQYGLPAYDAAVLCASRELADFYEGAVAASGGQAKPCANWVMVEVLGALNREAKEIGQCPISPTMLGGLVRRITDGTISGKIAKEVFEAMWQGEGDADAVIEARGLKQISDEGAIAALIDEVLRDNPTQVAQYRQGKEQVLAFFVGHVMKKSRGKANPQRLNALLRERLGAG
ncbi:MAG: Asp-tRNA(Asn)/Glu-tRNA(Gln) amidotransferase subunit GatB [Pseudomonadota bacterium]|nr:Asp-tRNA(Asn)/Glu-tRNA(Gln) amidotransferase subunit GatB [Gammaproteobacteria bacterium]MDQ3580766.1 Asp-tRNA(Asn)/Glu-tRNA(Gln) amidotransferase subunit GatB [Pseudomonadota bacterium]